MKKTFLLSAMMLICTMLFAQQPVITFQKTIHDFGKINEADGRVTTIFEFKNEGMQPLVLSNVRASCGCTTPTWTKTPIEPGQTGNITVTYNPNGRPGKFQKTITVTSNATEPTTKLTIKGEVIPKTQQSATRFPFQMGNAVLDHKALNFGNVLSSSNTTKTIEYSNNTDKPITIAVQLNDLEPWIAAQVSLITVEPKKVGTLSINIDGTKSRVWGQQASYIYLIVDNKRNITEDYKIILNYTIEEDFSKVDRRTAPILEIASREINLGAISAGSSKEVVFALKNAGVNPLLIRAINTNDAAGLKVTAPKTAIKSGKKQDVKLKVVAGQEVGNFRKQIDIITNDPQNPHTRVTIIWTVK